MTPYRTYAYGHDVGNSETCGVTWVQGMQKALVQPSAVLETNLEQFGRAVRGLGSDSYTGASRTGHTLQLGDGQDYHIGDMAFLQAYNRASEDLTRRGDITRYWSEHSLAMLLATAGTLITDKEFGLEVVTGTPVETYTEENKYLIKDALDGAHAFCLDNAEWRTCHVTVSKTVMEGAGAVLAYGPGGSAKVGVIDIGGRTTDLFVSHGITPVQQLCKGEEIGVESAGEAIISAFEESYGYRLSAQEVREVLHSFANAQPFEVETVKTAEVSQEVMQTLVADCLQTKGEQIAAFVRRSWRGPSEKKQLVASDFASVLLVGGGSYYFADAMKTAVPANKLSIPNRPEIANALGYAKLANSFLQRKGLHIA